MATRFDELSISEKTKKSLTQFNWVTMTEIQRKALPLALENKDVLGAAETGSGKTLSFVIPVLEKLYKANWNRHDGLGALIISPTRELALQIFDVLRKVGSRHTFSAGLVIGGKDHKAEATRITQMNILVCTPGRLLQHMDETPGFSCSALQILVLDEADRILDMGFSATVDALLQNVPRTRQTLLFSATQTKSVKSLARLSLHRPEFVFTRDEAPTSTPGGLVQRYSVVKLGDKLDTLAAFLRSHKRSRTIVFLSSCNQVRYIYEAFRLMRPGVPVVRLHGRMRQMKRLAIFTEFAKRKSAVMFATDIVARGLDFPNIDWVVQYDCPEDPATYIHRVGRTARYKAGGKALLLLTPSEVPMLAKLRAKKVPIMKTAINTHLLTSVLPALRSLMIEHPELKDLAQKAIVSYVRYVHMNPLKDVFSVDALDLPGLAASYGLATIPQIRVRGRDLTPADTFVPMAERKRAQAEAAANQDEVDAEAKDEGKEEEKKKKRQDESPQDDDEDSEASDPEEREEEEDDDDDDEEEEEGSALVEERVDLEELRRALEANTARQGTADLPPLPPAFGQGRQRSWGVQEKQHAVQLVGPSGVEARKLSGKKARKTERTTASTVATSPEEDLEGDLFTVMHNPDLPEADISKPVVSKKSLKKIRADGHGVNFKTTFGSDNEGGDSAMDVEKEEEEEEDRVSTPPPSAKAKLVRAQAVKIQATEAAPKAKAATEAKAVKSKVAPKAKPEAPSRPSAGKKASIKASAPEAQKAQGGSEKLAGKKRPAALEGPAAKSDSESDEASSESGSEAEAPAERKAGVKGKKTKKRPRASSDADRRLRMRMRFADPTEELEDDDKDALDQYTHRLSQSAKAAQLRRIHRQRDRDARVVAERRAKAAPAAAAPKAGPPGGGKVKILRRRR